MEVQVYNRGIISVRGLKDRTYGLPHSQAKSLVVGLALKCFFGIVRHRRGKSCFVFLMGCTEQDWVSNGKPKYIQHQRGTFSNVLKQITAPPPQSKVLH